MVYFLVNNNYHIFDLNQLYRDVKNMKLSLIQVPHTLNTVKIDNRFEHIYTYNKFDFSFTQLFLSFRYNKKILKIIDKELTIHSDDILFAYTEYDLTNQYIIEKFNKSRAKVYLLEDGTATAYLFMSADSKKSTKYCFKTFIVKLLYGMRNTRLLYDGNSIFPLLKDKCITGVCFYLKPNKIIRDIEAYQIKNNTEKINTNANSIIFLNQDVYSLYDDFAHYLETLYNITRQLSREFEKFYFKFHPRESNDIIKKISEIIIQNNGIVIDSKDAIEDIIVQYKPKYAASYSSASLINLAFMGIEPIFLHRFITDYQNKQALKHFDTYLKSLEYNFISSIEEINKSYESGLVNRQQDGVSIRQLVDDK